MKRAERIWHLVLGSGLFLFVSLYQLLRLPSVHFDEAWCGLFAYRIATEPGFWPWEAMNTYTGPVSHYALAGFFKVFGYSFEVFRLFFVSLNAAVFGLLAALLVRLQGWKTFLPFAVLFALVPVSVFDQRIHMEVTSWFALCYALILWGVALWDKKPRTSVLLLVLGCFLGLASHILFFAVILSVFVWAFLEKPSELSSRRGKIVVACLMIGLLPFPLRMGIGLKDPFPFLLATIFGVMGVIPFLMGHLRSAAFRKVVKVLIVVAALPPAAIYFILNFSGVWPYAQFTGEVRWLWFPLNLVLLCLLLFWARERPVSGMGWAFLLQCIFTGYSVLKVTSAKYWMIPTLTLILGLAVLAVEAQRVYPKRAKVLLGVFVVWNLFLFHQSFAGPFLSNGPQIEAFRVWRFADSSEDYRPASTVYLWLKEKGCHLNPLSLDRSRLQTVVEFLQALDGRGVREQLCPWGPVRLYIGNPSLAPQGSRRLATDPAWSDLEIWR